MEYIGVDVYMLCTYLNLCTSSDILYPEAAVYVAWIARFEYTWVCLKIGYIPNEIAI